jgi:hypothetical protein
MTTIKTICLISGVPGEVSIEEFAIRYSGEVNPEEGAVVGIPSVARRALAARGATEAKTITMDMATAGEKLFIYDDASAAWWPAMVA